MVKKKTIQQRYGRNPRISDLKKKLILLGAGGLLSVAVLVGVGLVALNAIGRSDFFQLTAIKIQGCQRTTKNQIMALSGVDVYSNLLALDLKKVKEGIESHEWVASADVERNWPNRLHITVREKVPVALVSLEQGLYYLDGQGIVITRVLPPDDLDYPVITGLSAGASRGPDKARLAGPLGFIRFVSRGSTVLPLQNISEVHLLPGDDMVLFLVDRPFPIYLGKGDTATTYYRLVRVLHRLYKTEEFSDTVYIRMDYLPDRVLVGKADVA